MRSGPIASRAGGFLLVVVAVGVGLLPLAAASRAWAGDPAALAIKSGYRTVMLAEFFGPARAVCSRLTADGVRAYTGGRASCAREFASDQRALALKLGGGRASAAARAEWRTEVSSVVAHLKLKVHGRSATAIDRSGVVRRTELVEVGRHWEFSSAPPLPGS